MANSKIESVIKGQHSLFSNGRKGAKAKELVQKGRTLENQGYEVRVFVKAEDEWRPTTLNEYELRHLSM